MNKGGGGQRIYRAKFSAVTPKDIDKAMNNLGEPNENESKAVEARQELDLKVGVAFSRFQTKYFQGKYGDLDSSVISYGPCQTPTLGFCVDRHDEIQTFSPEPFWSLDVTIDIAGRKVKVDWGRSRVFDQEVGNLFLTLLSGDDATVTAAAGGNLICTNVKTGQKRRTRPQPMNTVEMLKLASKALGIGPHQAMRSAENLYLSGYTSYPRTESSQYPRSFDFKDTLRTLSAQDSSVGAYAAELLRNGHAQARSGLDAGDHPPITPVGNPPSNFLSGDDARMYDLITRHFLASISPDAKFLVTTATFQSGSGEMFSTSGKKEIDAGFMKVYAQGKRDKEEGEVLGDDEDDEDMACADLPEILQGQSYHISNAKLREGKTTAPGYLTESELIGKMEKNGIGTDASIATHINNVIVRNYVVLGQGRTLQPTALGVVLVHGYLCIDPALVLPEVRAAIESFCNLIAEGKANKEMVVSHSLENFKSKFSYFTNNIERMNSLFEASFSPLAATGKFISKCGKCLRYMRYISLRPQRLYCQTCEATYPLPQNGTIKPYMELKCPLDNFELVLFSLGNSATA